MSVVQTKLTMEEPTVSQQECANHERKAEREERETAYVAVSSMNVQICGSESEQADFNVKRSEKSTKACKCF